MSEIVEKDLIVTFQYDLFSDDGELLDSSNQSGAVTYIHGYNKIFHELERCLEGRVLDEKFYVTLSPKQAYGDYDQNLVCQVSIDQFEQYENLKIGQQFEIEQNSQLYMVYISKIDKELVIIDGNHPLAGKTIKFDIHITEIRQAHPDELEDV